VTVRVRKIAGSLIWQIAARNLKTPTYLFAATDLSTAGSYSGSLSGGNFVVEGPPTVFPLTQETDSMNEKKLPSPRPPEANLSALSAASYKVLGRLQKGYAYEVHGAWRFRGSHTATRKPTLACLLMKGLAERVETDRYAQIRITDAGRSFNRESAVPSNSALRKPLAGIGIDTPYT
jgi:hypothetical protein